MDYKFITENCDIILNNKNCPPKIRALVNVLHKFGFGIKLRSYGLCVEDNNSYHDINDIKFYGKDISIRWHSFNNHYLEVNMYDYKIMLNKDLISIIEEIVMLNMFLKIPKYPRLVYFKKRNISRPIGEYYYKYDNMYDVISRKNCKFIRQKYKELFQFVDTYYSNSNSENFNQGEIIFKNTVRIKKIKPSYKLPNHLQCYESIWRDRHDYWDDRKFRYSRKEKHPWNLPFRNRNITSHFYV
jgi:hypothetical protein